MTRPREPRVTTAPPPAPLPLSSDLPSISRISPQNIIAVTCVLSYLKLLRYLQLSPRLSQLSATISHAAADLSGFFLIFITVFFAYAQVCSPRLVFHPHPHPLHPQAPE